MLIFVFVRFLLILFSYCLATRFSWLTYFILFTTLAFHEIVHNLPTLWRLLLYFWRGHFWMSTILVSFIFVNQVFKLIMRQDKLLLVFLLFNYLKIVWTYCRLGTLRHLFWEKWWELNQFGNAWFKVLMSMETELLVIKFFTYVKSVQVSG